jgi:hypothetical protein
MAISNDVLERVLDSGENEEFRRRLAEALTGEYTHLSEIGHRIFEVTGQIENVDPEHLAAADPEVVTDELRRCEIALARMGTALAVLAGRLGRPYDD